MPSGKQKDIDYTYCFDLLEINDTPSSNRTFLLKDRLFYWLILYKNYISENLVATNGMVYFIIDLLGYAFP